MNRVSLAFRLYVIYIQIIFLNLIVSGDDKCDPPFPSTDPGGNPTMTWNRNAKYTQPCCTKTVIYAGMESYCPYCARWVVNNICQSPSPGRITPFTTGSVTCIHMEIIMYGNMQGSNCQHGPDECQVNACLRCMFRMANEKQIYNVLCQHYQNVMNKNASVDAFQQILQQNGIDVQKIQDCVNQKQDWLELAQQQSETMQLAGTPTFVPYNMSQKDDYLNELIYQQFGYFLCDYAKSECCGYQCPM